MPAALAASVSAMRRAPDRIFAYLAMTLSAAELLALLLILLVMLFS
jgi:hypothetical protein